MTIMNNSSSFEMHDAIKVRRGATATMTNVLVSGSGKIKDLVTSKMVRVTQRQVLQST